MASRSIACSRALRSICCQRVTAGHVVERSCLLGLIQTFKGNNGSARKKGAGLLVLVAALGLSAGCETQSLFDPRKWGNTRTRPRSFRILHNLNTGIDEPNDQYVNAEDVRPYDLKVANIDYVIGRNDLIQVNISDLVQQNVETQKVSRVSESGNISLPWIGQVEALGKTEAQLEQAVIQAYKDKQLLPNAQVSVVTLEARNRSFMIGGAINRPGQYQILDSDFRLKDAIVNAGGETSPTGIEFIYIHRHIDQDQRVTGTDMNGGAGSRSGHAALAGHPGRRVRQRPRRMAPRTCRPLLRSQPGAPGAEGRTIIINNQPVEIPPGGQFIPAGGSLLRPRLRALKPRPSRRPATRILSSTASRSRMTSA